jgi:hypothetical protein
MCRFQAKLRDGSKALTRQAALLEIREAACV